jgi:hypothetical protein
MKYLVPGHKLVSRNVWREHGHFPPRRCPQKIANPTPRRYHARNVLAAIFYTPKPLTVSVYLSVDSITHVLQ